MEMKKLRFYRDQPMILWAIPWSLVGRFRWFRESRSVSKVLRKTFEFAGLTIKEKRDTYDMAGKPIKKEVVHYPKTEIYMDNYNLYLRMVMIPGQTSKQWEGKQDAFAHALSCRLVSFKCDKGIVYLTLQHTEMAADKVLYKVDREARYINIGYAPGRILEWDFDKYPHMLLVGVTGSGKSTFVRNLLVQMGKDWTLRIIDGKTVEFSFLKRMGYDVTTTKDDLLRVLEEAEVEMERRYRLMDREGVNEYHQAGLKPYFVLVDEFITLVESMATKARKGRDGERGEDKSEKDRLFEKLMKISTMGRAAGIQLILILQRPDSTFMPTACRDNLAAKVVLRGSEAALDMAYGSEWKRLSPLPKGQGYCMIEEEPVAFAFANYDLDTFKRDMDRGGTSRRVDREAEREAVAIPPNREPVL